MYGERHDLYGAESSLHWKLDPFAFEPKRKVGVRSRLLAGGLWTIVVAGGGARSVGGVGGKTGAPPGACASDGEESTIVKL